MAFASTSGHRAEGRYTQVTLDGIHQSDSSAGSGHATSSRLADIDGVAVGGLAAQRTLDGIAPHDIEPGEYEVVLAPECVATVAIFLGFYGFNAKTHLEGQSFAEVGKQQFDSRLTIVDDVTDPRALGVPFDHEGTPKQRIALVEDGITRALAHDRRTAGGQVSRVPVMQWPAPRCGDRFLTRCFVGGGVEPVESMIARVDRGLYVSTFNYCRVLDPKSLVVTGLTRNGTFLIENGSITGAVTNLRFTQSFVAALAEARVLGLGDDRPIRRFGVRQRCRARSEHASCRMGLHRWRGRMRRPRQASGPGCRVRAARPGGRGVARSRRGGNPGIGGDRAGIAGSGTCHPGLRGHDPSRPSAADHRADRRYLAATRPAAKTLSGRGRGFRRGRRRVHLPRRSGGGRRPCPVAVPDR